MARRKALLFDLDGTLTHTDPIHLRAFQHLLAEYGQVIDEQGYRENISGRSNLELGSRLFPDHTPDTHVTILTRKEALFREFAVDLTPLAGALELIGNARAASTKTALVTNAPRDNVQHMLAAIGLIDAFDTIVYGDEMARPKPAPLPYLTALERLHVDAADALAFEDSVPGIRAAKAAGIMTVGISTTLTEAELLLAGADLIAADFTNTELLALI